jgi:hypothetical protein
MNIPSPLYVLQVPPSSFFLDNPNIWWGVQMTQLLVIKSLQSPVTSSFLGINPPQHPVLFVCSWLYCAVQQITKYYISSRKPPSRTIFARIYRR